MCKLFQFSCTGFIQRDFSLPRGRRMTAQNIVSVGCWFIIENGLSVKEKKAVRRNYTCASISLLTLFPAQNKTCACHLSAIQPLELSKAITCCYSSSSSLSGRKTLRITIRPNELSWFDQQATHTARKHSCWLLTLNCRDMVKLVQQQ